MGNKTFGIKKFMLKKYAIVGTGSRAEQYIEGVSWTHRDVAEMVAFCDTNQTRMDFWNRERVSRWGLQPVPTYKACEFDRMIAEQRPDIVIVTSIDRTHHIYICRAMELGCDVITEKPMTIDAEKCQQIIDTQKRTGRKLTVTFNCRYMPKNVKVKEVLRSGIVGEITSVHFEWLLDTSHGADYFRRWHRNKVNSGGLLVHKATHHFDLINWWIESKPVIVFAMGDLKFYGKANAEKRGVTEFYSRSRNNPIAQKDPFALHVTEDRHRQLYYDAEHEDGYFRDQSVFGDGIDIEDNMGVMVRYANNVVMTYSLNAHSPWEGYRVCFNGTKGRLEVNVVETSFVDAGQEIAAYDGMKEIQRERKDWLPMIVFQPHWGKPLEMPFDEVSLAAHSGGDPLLLKDVLVGVEDDLLGRAADFHDGANSILVGIGANISMKTGLPVKVQDLIHW